MNEEAVTYVELDVPRCALTYGVRPCEARLGPTWGEPGAVYFDGTNDYLTRDAGLTGAADSKLMTFSGWVRLGGGFEGRLVGSSGTVGVGGDGTRIFLQVSTNKFRIVAPNGAGTDILNIGSSTIPTDGNWHHLMMSFDMSNPAKRHIYVDDVSDILDVVTYTDDAIDFTRADWSVGAYPGGSTKYRGRMAEVWFAPGVYIDLSVEANRRKFIDANKLPVDLGATGATPTGTAPLVYLSNRDGAFGTNKGTGGAFTLHGELDDADFGTGTEKCFNTRVTCQDLAHYDVPGYPTDVGTVVDTTQGDPNSNTITLTDRPLGDLAPEGSTRTIVLELVAYVPTGGVIGISGAKLNGIDCLIRKTQASGSLVTAIIEALFDPGTTIGTWVITTTGPACRGVRTNTHRMLDVIYNTSYSNTTVPTSSVNVVSFAESQLLLAAIGSRLMSTTVWTNATELSDGSVTAGGGEVFRYSFASERRVDQGAVDWLVSATQAYEPRSAPTFVISAGFEATETAVAAQSGLAVGDIVLAICETNDEQTVSVETTDHTWAQIATNFHDAGGGVGGTRLTSFWTRLTATSYSTQFKASGGGDHIHVRTIVMRGCVPTGTPYTAFVGGESNAGTEVTIPGVTTTIDNSLIVDIVGHGVGTDSASGWTNANLTGLTERYDGLTTLGNDGGSAGATGVKVSAGATGNTTVTMVANTPHTWLKVAFVPTDNSDSKMSLAVAQYDWLPGSLGTEETIRFGMDTGFNPKDIDSINCLSDVSHTPTVISLGEGLGTREAISVRFSDVLHPDVGPGFDKYWNERGYNPYDQGTLFGRLAARQPYLGGHTMRWYEGFSNQALSEMISRTFLIESFSGPSPNGEVTITGKDPLKLADSDKALAPVPVDGYLTADITDIATSASLSPAGIGNAQYPLSGFATLAGNELVTFTRVADALTIVRAQEGTPASAHEQEDRVQMALVYDGVDPANIIYDLLVNFAGVDPSWINLNDWLAETEAYLRRVYSVVIGEPTPVRKLISELIQHAGLAVWWDSEAAKINLIVLREVPADATVIDTSVRLGDSPTIKDQPDKRISQVMVYFGIKDPLKSATDPNNFRQIARSIDSEAEVNYETSAIKSIYARWIAPFARTTAFRIGDIFLGRFNNAPKRINFDLFRIGPVKPLLGGAYRITARNLQLPNGSLASIPIQIVSIRVRRDRYEVEAEEMRFLSLDEQDLANRVITISGTNLNLNLRSIHDDIYPALRPGDTIKFRFDVGSVTGSDDATLPSVDVGTWPAGFVPHIDVLGKIQGKGGTGGKGANEGGDSSSGGKNGQKGGTALYTRAAITLTDTTGLIYAGGGGGAGGSCADFNDHRGGGGGGGAGFEGGDGGIGPGNGEDGKPGTETAGGAGGRSYTSSVFWAGPELKSNVRGGDGGAPGVAGNNDVNNYDVSGGAPGAAGNAIDGISYVTTVGTPGTRLGLQVN